MPKVVSKNQKKIKFFQKYSRKNFGDPKAIIDYQIPKYINKYETESFSHPYDLTGIESPPLVFDKLLNIGGLGGSRSPKIFFG